MYSDDLWHQWIGIQRDALKLLRRKDLAGAANLVSNFIGSQNDPNLIGEALLFKAEIEQRRGNLKVAKEDLLKAHTLSSPATYHRYVVELSLAALTDSMASPEEARTWYVKALETVAGDPLTSGIAAVVGFLGFFEWGKLPSYERELCERVILQSWSLFSLPGSPNFDDVGPSLDAIQKALSQPLAGR